MEIDPVEEGAAQPLLIAGDHCGGAGALALAVAQVAAGAGVHRPTSIKRAGKLTAP